MTKLQQLQKLCSRQWRLYARLEPILERERLREEIRLNNEALLEKRRKMSRARKAWQYFQRVISRAQKIEHMIWIKQNLPRVYDWGITGSASVIEE